MMTGDRAGGPLSPPRSWRRYTPFIVIVMLVVVVQFFALTAKRSAIEFIMGAIANLTRSRAAQEEKGPLHVLLLTYARSGSSFLGDMLQSLPDTFYHFEPIHFLNNSVLNGNFPEARDLLKKLFHCNVSEVPGFMGWQKKHVNYMKFERSQRYWNACTKQKSCYDSSYHDAFCNNQSLVIIKTIRLKLREAYPLLGDPDLNLKIIYLARDPRGTANSRTKYPITLWCSKDPVCRNPEQFCSLLDDDIEVVCSLLQTRPNDFLILRYEDVARDPFAAAREVVKFLGLPSLPYSVLDFLKTHTSVYGSAKRGRVSKEYSTFRNSSITAMKWRNEITFQQLEYLQKTCQTVMDKLGYHSFRTMGVLRSNVVLDKHLHYALKYTCL